MKVIVAATAAYFAIDIQDATKLLSGIVFGLVQDDKLAEIEKCLGNAESVSEELNDAITNFMKGDLTSIMAGVADLGKIMAQLPEDLKDCENMQEDLTRIEAWSTIFADPWKLF